MWWSNFSLFSWSRLHCKMFIRQKLYAVLFATLYKNFFYIEQITAASFVTCEKRLIYGGSSFCTCMKEFFWLQFYILLYSGSVDGNNQLIIKGKYNQKQIENVLRRYISKYWLNSYVEVNLWSRFFFYKTDCFVIYYVESAVAFPCLFRDLNNNLSLTLVRLLRLCIWPVHLTNHCQKSSFKSLTYQLLSD